MDHGIPGEITVDVGEEFPVNPQIKGALKSLAGVMQVEEIKNLPLASCFSRLG